MSPEPADPERLADLHAQGFPAPWPATAFAELLSQPGVFAIERTEGFILMRVVADEAEILTLAVRPGARRQGLGRSLVAQGLAASRSFGADAIFLEVAEDNVAARRLYAAAGFIESGRRRDYYPRSGGGRQDALLLTLNLNGPASLR